jgi:hypothetical protein
MVVSVHRNWWMLLGLAHHVGESLIAWLKAGKIVRTSETELQAMHTARHMASAVGARLED